MEEGNDVHAHKLLDQTTPARAYAQPPPETREENFLTKFCYIPQRYILGVMGLMGVCNAYTMRVCLNLAITQMVDSSKSNETHPHDPYACPDLNKSNITEVIEKPFAIFDWDQKTQGLILSGFYYGYAATQVPGGYLAEKFGGKWTLGLGLLSTALFTFLTPVVVRAGGWGWLFVLRILQGMGEGPTMPALMIMLARWVPPNERGFQGALVFGGAQIGNIFGSFMSGILLANGQDWANVFYFFGGFGLLWFALWSLLCYSTPNTHPYISKKELNYLNANVTTAENSGAKDPVPWKGILLSAPVWALVWAAVGHDWGYYTMVTELPKYSNDVLKFSISKTGTLTALPYIAMWISSFLFGLICDLCVKKGWHTIKTGRIIHTTIDKREYNESGEFSNGPSTVSKDESYYTMVTELPKYSNDVLKFSISKTGTLTALPYIAMWISSFLFGLICDLCVKKGWHTIKTGRIIHTTIAATGPAICIIGASYAGCDGTKAMVYFVLSMALMGGFYSGMKVNALDLAPNYAGSLTSLVNTTSTFAGIITPTLFGALTPDSTLAQWRVAFWVCFAVLVGTNVIYCIWADGKQQWWDDVRQYGYPPGWKHGPLIREEIKVEEAFPLSDQKD